MKVSRIIVVLALAGFVGSVAMADGVDPTVIIRRVDPPPIAITSSNQTFNLSATATLNIFAFQNDTGVILTGLTLDLFAGTSNLLYSCGSFAGGDIFANCTSTLGSHNDTLLSFFGVGNGFTGISAATCTTDDKGEGDDNNQDDNNNQGNNNGQNVNHDDKPTCTGGIYSLEFDGIPQGATVRGTGTVSTPEPMTAVMLLSGIVGLAGLRKRRNS